MTKERLLAIYAQALDNCTPYVELDNETVKTEVSYILGTEWHNPKEAAKFLSLCPDFETNEPHWKNTCPHFTTGGGQCRPNEACMHEAWEKFGRGARRCADCRADL